MMDGWVKDQEAISEESSQAVRWSVTMVTSPVQPSQTPRQVKVNQIVCNMFCINIVLNPTISRQVG